MVFESESATKSIFDNCTTWVGIQTWVLSSRKSERDGSDISRSWMQRGFREFIQRILRQGRLEDWNIGRSEGTDGYRSCDYTCWPIVLGTTRTRLFLDESKYDY
ncbi:hypothetical protein Ddye_013383 [Dipteronia dyeriana]|uniref:Uncharacterized protein n=1 Tax=Dipteronia dyeriana TaxID=168575 RepID=A0AAD9X6D2_9ROSI|nr:hypothetical protein Ddye_013383 [Dipteronia dyeriana]